MSITITSVGGQLSENQNGTCTHVFTAALSSETVGAGGFACDLTASTPAFTTIYAVNVDPVSGYVGKWDNSAKKIMIYQGDHTGSAAPLVEVTGTVTATFRITAVGKR